MGKVRTVLGVAFVLTVGACQAETLINTDFSKGSTGWVLNNDAQLLEVGGKQVLSLTQNEGGQSGIVWTELKRQVPSFSFIADIRVRWETDDPGSACPADGMTLAFANCEPTAVGMAGGNLGLFNNPDDIPRFIALDINTWYGQGLGSGDCRAAPGRGETLSFANMSPDCPGCQEDPETGRAGYDRHTGQNKPGDPAKGGLKLGQVLLPEGLRIVNGGTIRYQWNVDGATNTMTVYVTGLDENNKQFQKVKAAEIKSGIPVLDFEGRWGITAATGGAVQHTDVLAARIDVPMIDPL